MSNHTDIIPIPIPAFSNLTDTITDTDIRISFHTNSNTDIRIFVIPIPITIPIPKIHTDTDTRYRYFLLVSVSGIGINIGIGGTLWVRPVKSEKIFGIFISDSYDEILELNWNQRFKKFSNIVYSWSNRILDTLQQRVEVIRIFGLSRVYYVAAVLPMKPAVVKKFESLMGCNR